MGESQSTYSRKGLEKSWIRQQDQSDCGVACLASVIHFYGGEVPVERVREKSGTTKTGTTLLGLYQAAPEFGLKAEPYEADIRNLKEVNYPCILHVIKGKILQHYIICFGYDPQNEHFWISDPAEGVRTMTVEELECIWQSKALLILKKSENFIHRKESGRKKLQWLKELAERDFPILGVSAALGLFIAILGLSTAVFTQKLIDDFLPDRDTLKLFVGLGLLIFLLLARNGLAWIRQLFLIRQSRDFNNRMIESFYSSLLRLPIPFFHNRKTGDLIARMNDTRRLQGTITYLVGDVIIDVLLVVTAAAFILYYSMWLGLFLMLSLPLFFLLAWRYHKPVLDGNRMVMKAHALNESNYVDTIQGISAIKGGNREGFFSGITKQVYGHFQETIYDLGKVGIGFSFWAGSANILFVAVVLGWGSIMVLNQTLMLGALIAVVQMSGQMIPAVNNLALTNLQLQEARVAFDRMYEFTSLEPEYRTNGKKIETSDKLHFKSLSFEELSFRFPGRSQLLKKVSLHIKRGEMIGILGESGSGKTTILHIIQRFFNEESGKLLLNGTHNLNEFSTPQWRSSIASVPQEINIFNVSLLQNIALCDITAPDEAEKVIQFCHKSGLATFFEKFPQGLATVLGEEGVNISGGQKQLVALARALYQKPQLLLLDEPTSAMDRETESRVLDLLSSLQHEMGIIMVTHRVQSIKHADRIYILENGEITASGSPKYLLESDNLFSKAVKDLQIS
jgi:ATP-binding cassette, subfamily C, bacteriocin exporter